MPKYYYHQTKILLVHLYFSWYNSKVPNISDFFRSLPQFKSRCCGPDIDSIKSVVNICYLFKYILKSIFLFKTYLFDFGQIYGILASITAVSKCNGIVSTCFLYVSTGNINRMFKKKVFVTPHKLSGSRLWNRGHRRQTLHRSSIGFKSGKLGNKYSNWNSELRFRSRNVAIFALSLHERNSNKVSKVCVTICKINFIYSI